MKKKNIFYFLIAIFILASCHFLSAQEPAKLGKPALRLLFFHSPSCHSCQKVKNEITPDIEKEFGSQIKIEYLDIADINNYKLLLSLKEQYAYPQEMNVPAIFMGSEVLVGYRQIKEELKSTILLNLQKTRVDQLDKLPSIDLIKRFRSFSVFAIVAAGLIDGINPCAFTVIVFFISFLAFQGYKKKELLAVGLAFILAVLVTYLLIGLGILRFVYSLQRFYLVTKIIYYSIATLCFILGLFALYDLWIFKQTRKTEGLILQLPRTIKNKIHSLIGLHYRKTAEEKLLDTSPRQMFRLITSAFVVGFLISLFEAVCTGQLYLPTITFILKDVNLRLRALGYLLLYNFMFILPMVGILAFALLGTSSERFSSLAREHLVSVKLLMALIFFALGLMILKGA